MTQIGINIPFIDDYLIEEDIGINGWNQAPLIIVNGNPEYHGWFNTPGTTYFFRYFDIIQYGYLNVIYLYLGLRHRAIR